MSGVTSTVVGLGIVAAFAVLFYSGVWFALPIIAVVLLIVAGGPVLRFIAERGAPGTDEPDVPTTGEASYEPVEPRHPTEQ
jgi:hypothetical protein